MNTELIDFIAECLGAHTVKGRAYVNGKVVFTCRCDWAGPAGLPFRRHVSSQVMAAALSATAQVHGENVARVRHEAVTAVASRLGVRMDAMSRLLIDSGELTPMGARQIRLAMLDTLDRAANTV